VAVSNLVRLLDLPDEVIELVQRGDLTEGHGRALLLAEDHGARRALARAAVAEGWSVRVTEERSRLANAGGSGGRARITAKRASTHPDQDHAASEIAGALAAALGSEVRVRPSRDGGYRAELAFATADEALEMARRLAAVPSL
jgi:ParB family chromosome partitioning protein